MPENGQQVDHEAEALKLLDSAWEANEEGFGGDPVAAADYDLASASVHASLAIAEGQERVAEEIRQFRLTLDEVVDPTAGPAHPAVIHVRTEQAEP